MVSDYYVTNDIDMDGKKLEAAKNHYKSGDYASALRVYQSMINSSSTYQLFHRMGKCYYKMNDLRHAEEFFKRSVELEKQTNPSYLYLGNINYKKEDLQNAIYNWVCSFAYKPEDENICLNLATSYYTIGMNFQSIFYYQKYLKYAQQKGDAYNTIKDSINKYALIAKDFYQKGKKKFEQRNYKGATEFLTFAVKNLPTDFDINYTLGNIYIAQKDNIQALLYLKQAFCIDNKSLDVLKSLTSVCINLGNYTGAYCAMRRMLPLLVHNQNEYYKTMQLIKQLGSTFDKQSYKEHEILAQRYFDENNYHFALIEYENCVILNDELQEDFSDKIEQVKSFINPENNVIKDSVEKGNALYKEGKFKEANKYFTKILILSSENDSEYQIAKSRFSNV